MNITEHDKEMFNNLKDTAQGKWLVDYLKRFSAHICDVRNMKETDSAKTMISVANMIDKEIIFKINQENKEKKNISFI